MSTVSGVAIALLAASSALAAPQSVAAGRLDDDVLGEPAYAGAPLGKRVQRSAAADDEPGVAAPAVGGGAALPAAPPSPEREVIQYSNGRYLLRGDGIKTPFQWVWVPNPPPPPQPQAAKDAPLYGWIDNRGVLHVTDSWEKIPQEHRDQAKRNQTF